MASDTVIASLPTWEYLYCTDVVLDSIHWIFNHLGRNLTEKQEPVNCSLLNWEFGKNEWSLPFVQKIQYSSWIFFSGFWTHKNNLWPPGGSNSFFLFFFFLSQRPGGIIERKGEQSKEAKVGIHTVDLTRCSRPFSWLSVDYFGERQWEGVNSLVCLTSFSCHCMKPPHRPQQNLFWDWHSSQANSWVDKWTLCYCYYNILLSVWGGGGCRGTPDMQR